MSLVVVTPAESTNLTTTLLVQTKLGLVGVDDTIFDGLVAAASDFVMKYINHFLPAEEVTETIPGYDNNVLMLSRTPIVSVSAISFYGDVITDFTIEDADAGILWRDRGWDAVVGWSNSVQHHVLPNSSAPKWSVTYTGGFVLPSFNPPAVSTLPASLQQAVEELIRVWYVEIKSNLPLNVTGVKVGDYSISFDHNGAFNVLELGVPQNVLLLLRPFKRIV